MQSSIPKGIRENIARAKGYLQRGEVPRALEVLGLALREGANVSLTRAARMEMEAHLRECLGELCRQPGMRPLLDPHNTGTPRNIPYQQGKEGVLATVLEGLGKILLDAEARQEREAQTAETQRRDSLMATGLEALRTGDLGRGRSFLRRVAVEFGQMPGLCMEVGRHLLEAEQHVDAAQIFEMAMEKTPKEAEAYSAAVNAYMLALEYEKAEAVFMKILRQFGGHASTYGRMARMYMAWNKRGKAEDFAVRALQVDKAQADALEVMARIERRG